MIIFIWKFCNLHLQANGLNMMEISIMKFCDS